MLSVQQAIVSKPLPNISFKPQQANDNPEHNFQCSCLMCKKYPFERMTKILQEKQQKLKLKVNQIIGNGKIFKSYHYQWVLKKLIIPHNKIVTRGVELFIPQTCFYKDGEVQALFLNRQLNDHHIKRVPKQKINNTLLQKFFNERRRKYRQKIAALYKKKPVLKKKPLFGAKKQARIDTKDAIIVRQNDGYQKLISQTEFINILLKRKQDPFWRNIEYMKNYMQTCGKDVYSGVFKYEHQDIKYQNLFKRAQNLMKVYSMNIQQGQHMFISQKQQAAFARQLRQSSKQAFCWYITYQIICFIQHFYDQKIFKMNIKLLVNQLGQCFLLQVYKVEKKEEDKLIKYNWTNEVYRKMLAEEEHKTFYSQKISINQQIQQKASLLQKEMQQQYEAMKNVFGLSVQEDDDTEEVANNSFFKKIHPGFTQDITDIFKKDKDLGVNKFKKVYLGFKPEKKPIVKPFHSNLVKTLHSMTPRLRVATPHDYVDFLRERRHSAFGRNSNFDSRKRSASNTTGIATPSKTIYQN